MNEITLSLPDFISYLFQVFAIFVHLFVGAWVIAKGFYKGRGNVRSIVGVNINSSKK